MIDRRSFLVKMKNMGIGLAAGSAAAMIPFRPHSALSASPLPDLDLTLDAAPDSISILPGNPTGVWRYQGRVLRGEPGALTEIPGSYLGPVIRVKRGQRVRVRMTNNIPQQTIIHWHGLHVPDDMDGHPRSVVPPGGSYLYEFTVINRAGTYWFHPHPHGLTGPQVYGGLAGLFLVSDPEEDALALPSGSRDIPLVIQDRSFDRDNQLVYQGGGMMFRMTGFLGDRILVNGLPDRDMTVERGACRLRILNGSNTRIYRLAWDDGAPLTVIGTDGGLLDEPFRAPYVMLGPAERLDVWRDFSDADGPQGVSLVSLPFDAGFSGGPGMMGGGMMGRGVASMPNGAAFPIMRFKPEGAAEQKRQPPSRLSNPGYLEPASAVNAGRPRRFDLVMQHMTWTINGRLFQMTEVAADETVTLGTTEIWEFRNLQGGMGMMAMANLPHPMHLHNAQFQVIGRTGGMADGFPDRGWKDTVLVMPGQAVRILIRFATYEGLYLYHCHNLEHEDMGMMRNYLVKKSA